MQTNFVGAIHSELFEYFMVDDGFNIPQKLTQIEKTAKKRYMEMSDKDVLNTIQELRKNQDYYKDQKLSPEEFKNWVKSK